MTRRGVPCRAVTDLDPLLARVARCPMHRLRNAFVYVYDEAREMPEETTSERKAPSKSENMGRQFNMLRCKDVVMVSSREFELRFDGLSAALPWP